MTRKLLFLLISLSLFACKKSDTVKVTISFINPAGQTAVGRNYNLSYAQMYLSNFELIDANDNATPIKDVILAKMGGSADDNSFSFTMPSGNFTKFRFHYGLDSITNNSDPSVFADSHPLSLVQGMYWGMIKYRFSAMEGTIDSSATKDQTPADPFSMHLGTDTLYSTITSTMSTLKGGDAININVNLFKVFVLDKDVFDLTNFSNHSSPSEIPNAISIVDNLTGSMHADITHN